MYKRCTAFANVLMLLPLLWALLLVAVPLAQAEETPEKTVRIAYVEFPPITYRDENGEPAGLFIDITRKVALEAGFTPDFLYLPVSRAYLYLSNGQIDAWPGVSNIPALEGEVLESWASPMPVQLSAWYLEGKQPLAHFSQLQDTRVIVIGGYTYGGLLYWLNDQAGITVTEAPNHRAALEMLKRNRGDYLLDYSEPVREILLKPDDDLLRESQVRSRNLAWLFSLASPRAALIRDAFDDAYIRLADRGEVPPVRVLNRGFVVPGFPEKYR
ncbi:MAG: transporter substrate-binding domain-containing protein [Gammaproteobacteria bacterium]|nr:MAG: transporter substrate-binding domain-containing protein [Gammaproteobacteria bacterium]